MPVVCLSNSELVVRQRRPESGEVPEVEMRAVYWTPSDLCCPFETLRADASLIR